MEKITHVELDNNNFWMINSKISEYLHTKINEIIKRESFHSISFVESEVSEIKNTLIKKDYHKNIKIHSFEIDLTHFTKISSINDLSNKDIPQKIINELEKINSSDLIFLQMPIGYQPAYEFYNYLLEMINNKKTTIMILETENLNFRLNKTHLIKDIHINEIINLNDCYSPLTKIEIHLFILSKNKNSNISLIDTKNLFKNTYMQRCKVGKNLVDINQIKNISSKELIGTDSSIENEFYKNNINKIFLNLDNTEDDYKINYSLEKKITTNTKNFKSFSNTFNMIELENEISEEKIPLESISSLDLKLGRISLRPSNKKIDNDKIKIQGMNNAIFIPSMPSGKNLVEYDHNNLKNYDYFYIEFDSNTHSNKYIASFLNSKFGKLQFKYLSVGNYIKKLNNESIQNIKIPKITINDQKEFLQNKNKIDKLKSNLYEIENKSISNIQNIDADTLFSNIPDHEINKLITAEESEIHEYKSSLRVDIFKKGKSVENYIIENWLKTIVAFLNTKGGNLLIGISDNKEILGLEKDGFKSQDDCHKFIVDKIKSNIGLEFIDKYIFVSFINKDEKLVCRIQCKELPKSFVASFGDDIYVRAGPSSRNLTPKEVIEWQNTRKDT